jgi:hypothetical protein
MESTVPELVEDAPAVGQQTMGVTPLRYAQAVFGACG